MGSQIESGGGGDYLTKIADLASRKPAESPEGGTPSPEGGTPGTDTSGAVASGAGVAGPVGSSLGQAQGTVNAMQGSLQGTVAAQQSNTAKASGDLTLAQNFASGADGQNAPPPGPNATSTGDAAAGSKLQGT